MILDSMNKVKMPVTTKPQIVIYRVVDEHKICVRIEDENVWLTQRLIAELCAFATKNIKI
jgi:hypothetical protein